MAGRLGSAGQCWSFARGQGPRRSLPRPQKPRAPPPRAPFFGFGSAAAVPPSAPTTGGEMGAPGSTLLDAGGSGQDPRFKFPGPRGSPPRALLSGVGRRQAAPQRREPGAAFAQRLRPRPTDGGSRAFPADPFVVPQPPNPAAGVEYSDLLGHCKAFGPFINSLHFLSQTMRTSRLAKRLGAEDPEVSGNPLSHP